MSQQNINIGSEAGAGDGDSLRTAFDKVNHNFGEVYGGNVLAANILVYSVAGRTGNVQISVQDVLGAASVGQITSVYNAIAANSSADRAYTDHAIQNLGPLSAIQITGGTVDNVHIAGQSYATLTNLHLTNNLTVGGAITSVAGIGTGGDVAAAGAVAVGTVLRFADLTEMSTAAFPVDVALINNKITAANACVSAANVEISKLGANVTAANAAIAVLQSNASAQGAGISSLGANVTAANSIISGHTFNIAQLNANISAANARTSTISSSLSNTNANVSLLLANAVFQNTWLSNLEVNISSVLSNISSLQANLHGTNIAVQSTFNFTNTVSTGLRNLNNDYYSYKASGQAYRNYLLSIAQGIQDGLDTANLKISKFNDNISILQSNVTSSFILYNNKFIAANARTDGIQAGITSANSRILSTNANVAAANLLIAALDISITNLQANAVGQSLQIDGLSGRANDLVSSVATLALNDGFQENEITGLRANITAANAVLNPLPGRITSVNANVAAANIAIASINANVTAANISMAYLSSAWSANAQAQETEIFFLRANIQAANAVIASLDIPNIGDINANIAGANVKIAALDANVGTLTTSVSGLSGRVTSLTTNFNTLVANAATQAVALNLLTANAAAQDSAILARANIAGPTFTGVVVAPDLSVSNSIVVTNAITASSIQAGSFVGQIQTRSQPFITTVGTLGNLTVSGNIVGNIRTAAQPSITSLGILTALAVAGNVAAGNVEAAKGTFVNIDGTLGTAAQPNITSVGALVGLAVTGNITAGNVSALTGRFANLDAVIVTASQPNITTVGRLANLRVATTANVTGNINVGANVNVTNQITATSMLAGFVGATVLSSNGDTNVGGNVNVTGDANITGNINGKLVGPLMTNAQPNVTSLGTLGNLVVSGNVVSANAFVGNLIATRLNSTTFAATTGSINTATVGALGVTTDITLGRSLYTTDPLSLFALSQVTANSLVVNGTTNTQSLGVAGNITAGNVSTTQVNTGTLFATRVGAVNITALGVVQGNSAVFTNDVSATSFTGIIATQGQPNITSIGLLSRLDVAGPTTLTGDGYVSGKFTVNGNLYVAGSTTTIDVSHVQTNQLVITVANGAATAALTNGAGVVVSTANAAITYDYASNVWVLNRDLVTGNVVTNNITGTLLTASQTNITAVGTLNTLSVTGNIRAPNLVASYGVIYPDGSIQTSAADGGLLTSQSAAVQANVTAANVEISKLRSNITAANSAITSIDANLGTVVFTTIPSVQANVTAANLEIGNLQGNITAANTEISNLRSNITAANSAIGNLRANITAANSAITTIDANLGTVVLTTIPGVQANVSAANVEIGKLQGNISAANVEIGKLQGNISAANVGISNVQGNITAANVEIGKLQGNISAANVEIGKLQGNISAANVGISNVQANITAANSAISTLGSNVGAYQIYANANIGTITTSLSTLNANVGAFQQYGNTVIGQKANLDSPSFTTTTTGNVIITGNARVTSNLYVGNIVGGIASFTSIQGSLSGLSQLIVQGNLQGNLLIANTLVYSANVYSAGNLIAANWVDAPKIGTQLTELRGTLQNGNQPNINAVGALTDLYINGNITHVNWVNAVGGGLFTVVSGTLLTNAQPYIESIGNLTTANVSGNISAGNVSANGTVIATNLRGTLLTASQTNITQVGTLLSLGVTGNISSANVVTGNILATGNISSLNSFATTYTTNGNITSANSSTGNVTASGNITSSGNILATGNVYASNAILTGQLTAAGVSITGGSGTINLGTGKLTAGQLNGNLFASNANVYATTQSNDTLTGALVVPLGGVGIGANLNVGGNLNVSGNTYLGTNLTVNGSLLTGQANIGATGQTSYLAGTISYTGTTLRTDNTTMALFTTSVTTLQVGLSATTVNIGATSGSGNTTIFNSLDVKGVNGLYVTGGNIYGNIGTSLTASNTFIFGNSVTTNTAVSGNLITSTANIVTGNISGNLRVGSTTNSGSSTTGALQVAGGIGVGGAVIVGAAGSTTSNVTINSIVTTPTNQFTQGALLVSGGAGIAGNIVAGGRANILSVTDSTSQDYGTGALTVAGGAGIAKNLNVGGDGFIRGGLTVLGPITATFSLTNVDNTPIGAITPSTAVFTTLGTSLRRPNSKPAIKFDFSNGGRLDPRITFTRNSIGTYVDVTANLKTAAANIPRFTYDGTGYPLGLLIEESRQNLYTYSQTFDNAAWTQASATVSSSTGSVGPEGTVTGTYRLVEGGVTAVHGVAATTPITISSATKYTASVFAKAGSRTQISIIMNSVTGTGPVFDLFTGAVYSDGSNYRSSIETFANGWYRCSTTGSSVNTNGNVTIAVASGGTATYTGDGSSYVDIYGFQFEQGAFATSYIPTTTVAVTRNADVASITSGNFNAFYPGQKGAIMADVRLNYRPTDAVNQYTRSTIVSIDDGTTSNRIQLLAETFPSTVTRSANLLVVRSGIVYNTVYGNIGDMGNLLTTTSGRVGMYFASNSFAFSLNANTAATATLGYANIAMTEMLIGSGPGAGYLNGTISKLMYYAKTITTAETQELSRQ
jgi:predicted  nucleic acid-binding Zn-ribbon protein